MAAYDLEEQERIDALKHWWKDNRALVITAAVAFIVAVAGLQGWRYYKTTKAQASGEAYAEFEKTAQANDAKKTGEAAAGLTQKFPDSQYAAYAALEAARQSFEAQDLDAAEQNLRWVIDHADSAQIKTIARLRLAAVLADRKQYDAALKTLDEVKDEAFLHLAADLKGDIHAVQGRAAEARAAYQLAIEKTPPGGATRQLAQIKLDALGEGK